MDPVSSLSADELRSEPSGPSTGRRLRALVREPLLHFLILGGLLYLAGLAWQRAHDPRRIVVDRFTLERIAVLYRQRFGEPPSPKALRLAVAEHVGDEVLYREGIAQGIDRDDEIIRRRVIQKMRFLQEDRTLQGPPPDADLRAYYARHRGEYLKPATASFSHIYFATDAGEEAARVRAAQMRSGLKDGTSAAGLGDPFPDRSAFADLSEQDAERVFGKSELSKALRSLPPGRWSEPLASGFGIHLVRIDHRAPPTLAPFEAIRDRVAADHAQDAQEARNRLALQALQRRYVIAFPEGKTLE